MDFNTEAHNKVKQLVSNKQVPCFTHPDSVALLTTESAYYCARDAVQVLDLRGNKKTKLQPRELQSIRIIEAVYEVHMATEGELV